MDMQMQDRVRQIIAEELQRAPSEVRSGTSLRKDLGMDSVAAINIVFALEDTFGVHVPESELEEVDDMDHIIRLVRHYTGKPRS